MCVLYRLSHRVFGVSVGVAAASPFAYISFSCQTSSPSGLLAFPNSHFLTSGNSGALDTLDSKLLVPANFQSSCSPRSFEQLESGAWHSELPHPILQLEAVPGSSMTSTSIPGVCCTPPHSPAIPSHFPPRRSQMAAPDGQMVENELHPPRRPANLETFKFQRNSRT